MRMKTSKLVAVGLVVILASSCAIVQPNEIGVKQRFGKLSEQINEPGLHGVNPFTTQMIRVRVQTTNLAIVENLPSREGLTIRSEASILYSIKANDVPKLIRETGLQYERDLILPVFRSASADICSSYDAKDMHSSKRGEIELAIQERMASTLDKKGITIESVLLKNIMLPNRIAESIERKLEAEQEALRMAFVAEQQKREMERLIIQEEGNKEIARIKAEGKKEAAVLSAEATAEATLLEARAKAEAIEIEAKAKRQVNVMLNETLSRNILELKRIEAFTDLAGSPNSKVLMLDGKSSIVNLLGDLAK